MFLNGRVRAPSDPFISRVLRAHETGHTRAPSMRNRAPIIVPAVATAAPPAAWVLIGHTTARASPLRRPERDSTACISTRTDAHHGRRQQPRARGRPVARGFVIAEAPRREDVQLLGVSAQIWPIPGSRCPAACTCHCAVCGPVRGAGLTTLAGGSFNFCSVVSMCPNSRSSLAS